MTTTGNLALDRERFNQLQDITASLEQLLNSENRPTEYYVGIRHQLLDAAEHLWAAVELYLEAIKREEGSGDGIVKAPL
jgi:hypothetical protein